MTLSEDHRGATLAKLPQGCSAYISHTRCEVSSLSALPAHSPTLPSVPIQIPVEGELCKPAITDSYQTISKLDPLAVAATMYSGIIPTMPLYGGTSLHPLLTMYDQRAHADEYTAFYSTDVEAYIDFGPEPVKTTAAYELHPYFYQNAPDATAHPSCTSGRRASVASSSTVLSPPRLSSPWRESSNSPSSMHDYEELQTPNIECFDGANIASTRDTFAFPSFDAGHVYASVMSATARGAPPPWGFAKSFPKPLYGAECTPTSALEPIQFAAWSERCAVALAEDYALLPSIEGPPQPSVSALPPSAFVHTQPAVPAAMPDLQHPRPQRAFVPDWQGQTEFDLKQFVKESWSGATSPTPQDAPQPRYSYDAAAAPASCSGSAETEGVEQGEMEEYDEDEEMEMDEGWEEDDDDANSDQGTGEDETELCQERPGDAPAASEVCIGPSMGLGFGRSRTLDANCLLYQPIAGYVRWPEGANFAMPSYAFTF